MKKIDYIFIGIILIVGLATHLYKISSPMGDFHSWRQSDTAAVSRHFVQSGFDLLHPRYDDISAVTTGKENPNGYRMVEFPLYNAAFAGLYVLAPVLSLEFYGRLVSIVMTLICAAIIYYLLKKEVGIVAAVSGSLIFSTFPFFVFFTRVVLPEPTATSLAFLAIFFIYLWAHSAKPKLKYIYLLFGTLSFASALLIKPTAIFYGIPLLYLFTIAIRKERLTIIAFLLFFGLSAIPVMAWRQYITLYPQGIPPSDWLIRYVNTYRGLEDIFFKPAFFRWIFYKRIQNLIFGGFATIFFVLGIISKQKRLFLLSILAGALAYLFVFQGGNVQHQYYQTMILPALAIFAGIGIHHIVYTPHAFVSRFITIPAIIAICAASIIVSWYQVKDYYQYSSELVQIASIVKSLTQPEDKIVTDRIGDTTLLYLMERKGSPALFASYQELHDFGYTYLVTMNKETIGKVKAEHFRVVFENDKFALIHL